MNLDFFIKDAPIWPWRVWDMGIVEGCFDIWDRAESGGRVSPAMGVAGGVLIVCWVSVLILLGSGGFICSWLLLFKVLEVLVLTEESTSDELLIFFSSSSTRLLLALCCNSWICLWSISCCRLAPVEPEPPFPSAAPIFLSASVIFPLIPATFFISPSLFCWEIPDDKLAVLAPSLHSPLLWLGSEVLRGKLWELDWWTEEEVDAEGCPAEDCEFLFLSE